MIDFFVQYMLMQMINWIKWCHQWQLNTEIINMWGNNIYNDTVTTTLQLIIFQFEVVLTNQHKRNSFFKFSWLMQYCSCVHFYIPWTVIKNILHNTEAEVAVNGTVKWNVPLIMKIHLSNNSLKGYITSMSDTLQ